MHISNVYGIIFLSHPDMTDNGEAHLPASGAVKTRRPAKKPYLPVPGQATMIRESTRRRLGKDLMGPFNALSDTVATMRRIRKHRAKQFAECERSVQKGMNELMKISEDAYYLFHEMGAGDEKEKEVPESKTGKKRALDDAEEAPRKRRRTRNTQKVEMRIIRNIGHIATQLGNLKRIVDGFGVQHEIDVQRTARDQIERLANDVIAKDKEHDKMIAGWQTLRMGKEAVTFVAAHSANTPCRMSWSPYGAFDPQLDQLQASEAAQRRRKPLSVATYLEETRGKKVGQSARHVSGHPKAMPAGHKIRRFKTSAQPPSMQSATSARDGKH